MSSQEIPPLHATPHMLTYRLTFLISGLCMGAWAPLVPYARERAGIDDGKLGLLLLCLGLGSLAMMPLAGIMNARKGCRFSLFFGLALVCVTLPLLATLEHFDGNKQETADALGVSLKTLYNRLNAYKDEDG